ncbi:MAG: TlpA disulfide reductase family protein [Brachymonas sp.]|nr:TlpA disulfide reductase family protein [Brachymonas sp.]
MLAVGLLAVALAGCQPQPVSAPASRFVLLDGHTKTENDLRGYVTLVNFWATSCTTCVAEMPLLVQTYQQYQARGYRTLAVAMQYDPVPYVVNFAQTRQLPFEVAIDNTGQLAKDWGPVRATPTSFLVNKRGQIVQSYVGPPDAQALQQAIEKLLAEQP